MQPALFYEDIYDAMRDVVTSAGGPKAVGQRIWPDKSVAIAHTAVLNCLDRNRPEKFSLTQIVLLLKIGREVGCHAAMNYLCAESGYSHPLPIEPEDELSKMLREYLDIEHRRAQLQPRIEEARVRLAK